MNHGASSSTSPNGNGNGNGDPYHSPYAHDETDELDLLGDDSHHHADDDTTTILRDDPLQADLSSPLTFKRKQKQSGFLSQPARLFNALTGRASNHNHTNPSSSFAPQPTRHHDRPPPTDHHHHPSTHLDPILTNTNKDAHPLDWHVEGPGRRVGYEDLTAIDWIFEYTKERQRQRALHASSSSSPSSSSPSTTLPALLSYLARLLDASQVWIVLILSGLAVGALAAGIDVATDWLGDIKYGFCSSSVDGGRFYLSKTACCYGYDESSLCAGWKTWGEVFLGEKGKGSGAGKWVVEGGVYLVLAVVLGTAAAVLVREFAVYARHSGIPEIKTVLGGFIIRRFLGVQTLVTKSLGLVGLVFLIRHDDCGIY